MTSLSPRLAILLEERRERSLDHAAAAELQSLLADPQCAAAACAAERLSLLIAAGLAPPRSGADLVASLRAVRLVRPSRGLRLVEGVRRRVRRRRLQWPALAAAALLLVVGGGLWLQPRLVQPQPGLAGQLTVLAGTVAVEERGTWLPLQVGAVITGDQAVRTPLHATARLGDGHGLALDLGADSLLRATHAAPTTAFALEAGSLELEVPHQSGGGHLSVTTPHATATVVGTRFTVATDTDGTRVSVREGLVRVADQRGENLVHPGESIAVPAVPDPRWSTLGLVGIAAADDGWLAAKRPVLRDEADRELPSRWLPTVTGGTLASDAWTIRFAFQAVTEGVSLRVDLEARPGAPAVRIGFVNLLQPPTGGWPTADLGTRDDLPILTIGGKLGQIAVIGEAESSDLRLTCRPSAAECRIEVLAAAQPAGGSQQLRLHLGAAPNESEPAIVAQRLQAFAMRHPLVQRWNGINRLGMFGYAGGALPSEANPNCWFGDRIDVRTAAGRDLFRTLLLEDADAAIAGFRTYGADGVIMWGLEGSRHLNQVGFIADPRRLPDLAPEMDAAADALFARFSQAGLRTGVLIRPWLLEHVKDQPRFRYEADTAESELSERITYARKRWGCTLFMVMFASNGRAGSGGVTATVLARLAERFPDITLATDLDGLAWRGVAGGWQELGHLREPQPRPWWRRVYPSGRELLMLTTPPTAEWGDPLRRGLERGGVPLLWLPGRDASAWLALLNRVSP